MGNNFNKLIYSVIVLLFILILGIKFFFKRQLPLEEEVPNKIKNQKGKPLNPRDEGADSQVNVIRKLEKAKILTKKTPIKNSPSFQYKGATLKISQYLDLNHALLVNQANGKTYKMTNKVFLTIKDQSKFKEIQQKHKLKLLKQFNHLNLYYIDGPSIAKIPQFAQKLRKEEGISDFQYEIIQRDPKPRANL